MNRVTKKKKRIMTTFVSMQCYREPEDIKILLDFANRLISIGMANKVDALFLPAGFITLPDYERTKKIMKRLERYKEGQKMAMAVGVDLEPIIKYPLSPNAPKMLKAVQDGNVPCLITTFNREGGTDILRQRSNTLLQVQRRLIPDDIMIPNILDLGNGIKIQLIFCGEVYDKRLFREDAPKVAIVCGHRTMPRLSRTLIAKSGLGKGFTLFNSEHRRGAGGMMAAYRNGKRRIGTSSHFHYESGLWADLALWDIDADGRFENVRIGV